MSLEYASKGLVALMTPQANTTVEPEFSVLMPPGYGWLNARLTSDRPTIEDRLRDYMKGLPDAVAQFGNAPIDALALGCTGTAYFVGAVLEDQILKDVEDRLGAPAFSAATAVVAALQTLGVSKVFLISPYTATIDDACVDYWRERGFTVVGKHSVFRDEGFHPIYALQSDAADAALAGLRLHDAEVVLILGTGMPTLRALVDLSPVLPIPILSCMQCLGWRAVAQIDPSQASPVGVLRSARGDEWRERLWARLSQRPV